MVDLLSLDREELARLVQSWGQPRYRAAQLWQWLYRRQTQSPEEMTNLPAALRRRLAAETIIGGLEPVRRLEAEDGLTHKVMLRLPDGAAVEAVLMHYGASDANEATARHTVCVSSQVGCAIGCRFCATGQQGWMRDLTAGEIVGQVLYVERELAHTGAHVTNVVFMGMGEPLLNRDAVWRAIGNLNDPAGLGLGARRFTVSTAGVVPGIRALAEELPSVGLAVSLHAANDTLRDALVPLNRRYPLATLLEACWRYAEVTGRRVTFEYALIDGVNDSQRDASQTAGLLRGRLSHVNLIPLNPTAGCGLAASPRERVTGFGEVLRRAGIPVTVRLRRGVEVQAGCGQLCGDQRGTGTPPPIPDEEQYASGTSANGAHRAVDPIR